MRNLISSQRELKKLKTNHLVCKQLLHTSWLAGILNCWLRVNHFLLLLLHILNLSFHLPRPSKKERQNPHKKWAQKQERYSQKTFLTWRPTLTHHKQETVTKPKTPHQVEDPSSGFFQGLRWNDNLFILQRWINVEVYKTLQGASGVLCNRSAPTSTYPVITASHNLQEEIDSRNLIL